MIKKEYKGKYYQWNIMNNRFQIIIIILIKNLKKNQNLKLNIKELKIKIKSKNNQNNFLKKNNLMKIFNKIILKLIKFLKK